MKQPTLTEIYAETKVLTNMIDKCGKNRQRFGREAIKMVLIYSTPRTASLMKSCGDEIELLQSLIDERRSEYEQHKQY